MVHRGLAGVDYRACFDAPPYSESHSAYRSSNSITEACDLSIACLASLLCFNKAIQGSLQDANLVPPQFAHTFPLLLFAYVAQKLLLPWRLRGTVHSEYQMYDANVISKAYKLFLERDRKPAIRSFTATQSATYVCHISHRFC